jgi:hypothetical protein
MHAMATITGDSGRAAADIIEAAQKRHVPVLTKREAAGQAGISVEGWDKVIRTGRGRDTTFAAMARVVGVEADVRAALGLPAVSDEAPLDAELAEIEARLGLDLSSLPADLRRALLRHYQALDARMSELERREAERQDRPAV